MTENELNMPTKFEETNFFIISPKPTIDAKIVVSMLNLLDGMTNLQISHMADIQNSSRMSPTSYLREHSLAFCEIP